MQFQRLTFENQEGIKLSARLDLPMDEPLLAAKRYQEITAAEVQAAFSKWIRPEDLVQVSLGPNPD